jgi:hypothetical protein
LHFTTEIIVDEQATNPSRLAKKMRHEIATDTTHNKVKKQSKLPINCEDLIATRDGMDGGCRGLKGTKCGNFFSSYY